MRIASATKSWILRPSLLLVATLSCQVSGCRPPPRQFKFPVEVTIALSVQNAQTACARESQMEPDCINLYLRTEGNGILEVIPADDDYESAPNGTLIVGEVRRTSDGRYLTAIAGATPLHCKIPEDLPRRVRDDEMEWYRDEMKNSKRAMVVVYHGEQLKHWR